MKRELRQQRSASQQRAQRCAALGCLWVVSWVMVGCASGKGAGTQDRGKGMQGGASEDDNWFAAARLGPPIAERRPAALNSAVCRCRPRSCGAWLACAG